MTLELTKILLGKLNSGELQNLAVDILSREKEEWGIISHSGIVEGTKQTRKGTPDAWCKTSEGNTVYIQATGDKAKGKMQEDLNKSIELLKKLKENDGAICVAFLNYEPQAEEISKCTSLCDSNGCEFEYYTNGRVSDLLNTKYEDLKEKYLGIKTSKEMPTPISKSFSISKKNGNPAQSANSFIKILDWPELNDEEHAGVLSDINSFYNTLKKINRTSLQFYTSLVELGETRDSWEVRLEVSAGEVENELNIDAMEISKQMNILEKYGMGYIDDGEYPVMLGVAPGDVSWPLLIGLKDFSRLYDIPLSDIIVGLDFSLLD